MIGYILTTAMLLLIGLAWLYLAADALVNGDPFKWAWRKVSRRRDC